MRRRIRKISSQILVAQLVILTAATAIGFALFAVTARARLDEEYQTRAAAIAETFAENPDVAPCMTAPAATCDGLLQRLATTTAARTGAAYVVLIDPQRVRHTHPDPTLIGRRVEEPFVVADGRVHLGVDNGSTGVTANARVPLLDGSRAIVGEVSVGIQESTVSQELWSQLPSHAVWVVAMFAIGVLASFGLAWVLKRRTFGLELDEIAHLLQEREAILHGIREGVVAVDRGGTITVVNDEARVLLGLAERSEGHRVADVVPTGPVRELLSSRERVVDELLPLPDRWVVANRMPVVLDGRDHGVVVTVQDRTVLESLARELDGERSLTESMRAQQHEFSNRMHAVAGLLELDRVEEAREYVDEIRGTSAELDHALRSRIAAPSIVGVLMAKVAEAHERGIRLVIDPATTLSESPPHLRSLVTVVGNLIDNALDAVSGRPSPRRVEVRIVEGDDDVTIEVADTGPGIAPDAVDDIFRDGVTTKRDPLGRHSGLGLALVHRTATELGGTVGVDPGPGARFTVRIPAASRERA